MLRVTMVLLIGAKIVSIVTATDVGTTKIWSHHISWSVSCALVARDGRFPLGTRAGCEPVRPPD